MKINQAKKLNSILFRRILAPKICSMWSFTEVSIAIPKKSFQQFKSPLKWTRNTQELSVSDKYSNSEGWTLIIIELLTINLILLSLSPTISFQKAPFSILHKNKK